MRGALTIHSAGSASQPNRFDSLHATCNWGDDAVFIAHDTKMYIVPWGSYPTRSWKLEQIYKGHRVEQGSHVSIIVDGLVAVTPISDAIMNQKHGENRDDLENPILSGGKEYVPNLDVGPCQERRRFRDPSWEWRNETPGELFKEMNDPKGSHVTHYVYCHTRD